MNKSLAAALVERTELPGVHSVLRCLETQFDHQLGGVCRLLADRRHFGAFGGGEILQHERRRVLAARGSADTDPDPLKVLGAQRAGDRAQPVMTALAATELQ